MDNSNKHNNCFEESLNHFSSSDTFANNDILKKSKLNRLLINSLLAFVFIAMFGYAGYMLIAYSSETGATIDMYEEIRPEIATSLVAPATHLPEPTPMYTILQQHNEYQNYYDDVVSVDEEQRRRAYYKNFITFSSNYDNVYGWLYVSGTQIDYPIMKSDVEGYYLDHDYRGNISASGSIFADERLSDNFPSNKNVIINGHCMKNGTMFRSLKTFMESANRNTIAKNMVIEIYRPEGIYVYSVLSGYRDSTSSFMRVSFINDNSFYEFLRQAVARNTLSVSSKYDENSKICTLVTCANVSSNKDERYVLQCILTSFVPSDSI